MCDKCVFLLPAKKLLEQEAGFRCGHPSCRVPTTGPSNASASGLSQTGQAAHIAGASRGAKRYKRSMSHQSRSSHKNGIWLCETHAKLIDTDAQRFPSDLLHRWKRQLRHLVQRAHGTGRDFAPQSDLIRLTRRLPPGLRQPDKLISYVHDFLIDVGASEVWSRDVRDDCHRLLAEVLLNALEHGGGTFARLESRGHAVRLIVDGRDFGLEDLAMSKAPGGGARTLRAFREDHGDAFVASHLRSPAGRNTFLVTDIRKAPVSHNPCAVRSRQLSERDVPVLIGRMRDCHEVHVYFEHSWTMSLEQRRFDRLRTLTGKTIILHGVRESAMVREFVAANPALEIRVASSPM